LLEGAQARVTGLELPPDAPQELAEAVLRRAARVVEVKHGKRQHRHRIYLRLKSPSGSLHALYSRDLADARIIAHEVVAREVVGVEGPLRAPPVLEAGELWLLGAAAERKPVAGAAEVEIVGAAAERLAGLRLPRGPHSGRDVSLLTVWGRRLRLLRSPLGFRDLVEARRLIAACDLPAVSGHGYFHRVHVFLDVESAWVIDWELCGPLPAGYDLMNYWAGVANPATRAGLFDAALELVGRSRERDLRRLRYALLVRSIAAHLMDPDDLPEARRMLALLPEVRAASASPRAPSPRPG
jgi:hypothetical protein